MPLELTERGGFVGNPLEIAADTNSRIFHALTRGGCTPAASEISRRHLFSPRACATSAPELQPSSSSYSP
jgi:hypothetical protein